MGKLAFAAKNFVPNFLIAFAVGTFLRNRRTGVKAGIALGIVAAVAAVLLSTRVDNFGAEFDDLGAEYETEVEVENETSGTDLGGTGT